MTSKFRIHAHVRPFARPTTQVAALLALVPWAAAAQVPGGAAVPRAVPQEHVPSSAQTQSPAPDATVRASALRPDLAHAPEAVRTFFDHVSVLADARMDGRLPGTEGMELATRYVEDQFRAIGLVAPFGAKDGSAGEGSYRQSFELGSKVTVSEGHLSVGELSLHMAGEDDGEEVEFVVTTMGGGGEVTAPAVFVGYAIDRGPREEPDFSSFPEGLDLTGKVALVLRFEPMNEAGGSRWVEKGWSPRAAFHRKLATVQKLGAAAAVIINPPGASDPRAHSLVSPMAGTRPFVEFPVLHVSAAAGGRLLGALAADDPNAAARDLEALRRRADTEALALEFARPITLRAGLVKERLLAENVVGLLPGKGALADQCIVLGAHLDHLGHGAFGSRDREAAGRELHPGADDNASGTAGVIMIASRLAREYREAAADTALRSVVFIGFSAEESGLNGSAHYVAHPVRPLEATALMLNFDMIGRIEGKRLHLHGARTGDGLAEFVAPFVEASPLDIQQPERMSGASDHTPFYRRGVPVLFAINDLHDDYHTPRDTIDRINPHDAVFAIDLFHDIVAAAAARPEPFAFARDGGARRPGGR